MWNHSSKKNLDIHNNHEQERFVTDSNGRNARRLEWVRRKSHNWRKSQERHSYFKRKEEMQVVQALLQDIRREMRL